MGLMSSTQEGQVFRMTDAGKELKGNLKCIGKNLKK